MVLLLQYYSEHQGVCKQKNNVIQHEVNQFYQKKHHKPHMATDCAVWFLNAEGSLNVNLDLFMDIPVIPSPGRMKTCLWNNKCIVMKGRLNILLTIWYCC